MDPLVSICCLTYNHVNFINETIESFLTQKTIFPIEIIINDDASTDGTMEILKEYEKKYPDLIFPKYHDENEYSKGILGISARNNYPRARGKYIALCEGDDYWTDPLKLQKQIDFMEANPDAGGVGCFYHFMIHNGKDMTFQHLGKEPEFIQYNFNDYLQKGTMGVRSLTMVYKAEGAKRAFQKYQSIQKLKSADDVILVSNILKYTGDIYLLPFFGAVYRKHEKGASSGLKNRKDIRKQIYFDYEGVMKATLDTRNEKFRFWLNNMKSTIKGDLAYLRINQILKDLRLIFS